MAEFQLTVGQNLNTVKNYVTSTPCLNESQKNSILKVIKEDKDQIISDDVELGLFKSLLQGIKNPKLVHRGIQNPTGCFYIDEKEFTAVTIYGKSSDNKEVVYHKSTHKFNGKTYYEYEYGDNTYDVDEKNKIQSRSTYVRSENTYYHDNNFDGIYDTKSVAVKMTDNNQTYFVDYERTEDGNWQMVM